MYRIFQVLVMAIVLGCSSVSGLRAISPKPGQVAWVSVPRTPTLTPTLQWEAFPREKDVKKLAAGNASRIALVKYQLRLWVEGEDRPHASGGINFAEWVASTPEIDVTSPSYTIPTPLHPDTRYRWSVRAWYRLDGQLRVTQWSRFVSAEGVPNTYEVPDVYAFDFMTPKFKQ